MRNCKIATAEERLGMSSGATIGGEGTGGAPLGTALVGRPVGTTLRMDVSDGRTVRTIKGERIAKAGEREVLGQHGCHSGV